MALSPFSPPATPPTEAPPVEAPPAGAKELPHAFRLQLQLEGARRRQRKLNAQGEPIPVPHLINPQPTTPKLTAPAPGVLEKVGRLTRFDPSQVILAARGFGLTDDQLVAFLARGAQ